MRTILKVREETSPTDEAGRHSRYVLERWGACWPFWGDYLHWLELKTHKVYLAACAAWEGLAAQIDHPPRRAWAEELDLLGSRRRFHRVLLERMPQLVDLGESDWVRDLVARLEAERAPAQHDELIDVARDFLCHWRGWWRLPEANHATPPGPRPRPARAEKYTIDTDWMRWPAMARLAELASRRDP
jgi:hypothetical protein